LDKSKQYSPMASLSVIISFLRIYNFFLEFIVYEFSLFKFNAINQFLTKNIQITFTNYLK
jgi:hypothetical protein